MGWCTFSTPLSSFGVSTAAHHLFGCHYPSSPLCSFRCVMHVCLHSGGTLASQRSPGAAYSHSGATAGTTSSSASYPTPSASLVSPWSFQRTASQQRQWWRW